MPLKNTLSILILCLVMAGCGSQASKSSLAGGVLQSAVAEAEKPSVEEGFEWTQNTSTYSAPIVEQQCTRRKCKPSVDYAWALENEFWRHIQREDVAGMRSWIKKTSVFVDHRVHRGGNKAYRARLMFLIAMGYSANLTQVDFALMAPIVSDLQSGNVLRILAGMGVGITNSAMGAQLAQSMRWLLKSYWMSEGDVATQNSTRIAIQSVGINIQAMAPNIGEIAGAKAVEATLYGPSCKGLPAFLRKSLGSVCTDNGLIGPGPMAYTFCQDDASCRNVGNGHMETFSGAASVLVRMHDRAHVQKFLDVAGDTQERAALCEAYWCRFIHPRDPEALIPEKTSMTPFKRVVNLLSIAESYAKVGNLKRMDLALTEAHREAERLKYPFMDQLRKIDIALHGGDASEGIPNLVEKWANRDERTDTMGALQVPFPLSTTIKPCAGCHFGGVLPRETAAFYGK